MPAVSAAPRELDERPAKRFRPSYSETIEVLIGEEEEVYTVHKNIILNKSPYFEAACKREWQSDKEGVVPLKSVDTDTFELYLHWIYSNAVELDIVEPRCSHEAGTKHSDKCKKRFRAELLIKLYVAADLLLDPDLKNTTMDAVVDHIRRCLAAGEGPFTWKAIDDIWTTTPDPCALRSCTLDYFVAHTSKSGFSDNPERINAYFLRDLCNKHFALGLTQHRSAFKSSKEPLCIYHDHDHGEPCRHRNKNMLPG